MSPDLLAIARRHLAQRGREGNEDNAEKPPPVTVTGTFSPFSSITSAGGASEPPAPPGWGCHRKEVDRLIAEAESYFERSGVSGLDPTIRSAAAMVVSAQYTYDIETLRFAVVEFRAAVAAVIASRHWSCYHRRRSTRGSE